MTHAEIIKIVKELYSFNPEGVSRLSLLIQRLRPYIAPFHKLLPLVPKGSHVLDVGCGSGLWAGLLFATSQADYVYGFDSSKKAIDIANRMKEHWLARTACGRDKLLFEYRSVTEGMPNEQFDVVSMVDVMHHIPPKFQDQVLLYVWNCVKPGGLFVYKDMNSKPWYIAV